MSHLADALLSYLEPHGLDIVAPVTASAETLQGWQVPIEGEGQWSCALVGNTRALWTPLLSAYAGDATLQTSPAPLDTYVERCLRAAVHAACPGARIFWGHEGPPYVALRRIAETSGLAEIGPVGLAIHAEYGPWFALRALVCSAQPQHYETETEQTREASHCRVCPAPCVTARALCPEQPNSIRQSPEPWIAVRDACPVGKEHRYSDAQVLYHYTQNRIHLRVD